MASWNAGQKLQASTATSTAPGNPRSQRPGLQRLPRCIQRRHVTKSLVKIHSYVGHMRASFRVCAIEHESYPWRYALFSYHRRSALCARRRISTDCPTSNPALPAHVNVLPSPAATSHAFRTRTTISTSVPSGNSSGLSNCKCPPLQRAITRIAFSFAAGLSPASLDPPRDVSSSA